MIHRIPLVLVQLTLISVSPSLYGQVKSDNVGVQEQKLIDSSAIQESDSGDGLVPVSVEERFKAIQKRYEDALTSARNAFNSASTQAEKDEIIRNLPTADDFADEFLALAKDHPNTPTAVNALFWVARQSRSHCSAAIDVLTQEYANYDGKALVHGVLRMQASREPGKAIRQLRVFADETVSMRNKATALFALGSLLAKQVNLAAQSKSDENIRADVRRNYGDEFTDELVAMDVKAIERTENEAIAILEDLVENYPEVNLGEGFLNDNPEGNVSNAAKRSLFDLMHLGVGKVAPEIIGEDISGEEFKLSDYRGNVILLEFWGHW